MKAKEVAAKAATAARNGTKKTRVLVVDDHPLFRHGVMTLINSESDLVCCGEADSSASALGAMRRLKPDLMIVDVSLHGANGIELIKSVKAEQPNLPVLVVSMHDEFLYAMRALKAGARGYVMKAEALDRIMGAIRQVMDGAIYVSSAMSGRMLNEFVHGKSGGSLSDKLTDRELEVLQLIGQGRGVQEIARELNLSAKTVESHRSHIKEKFDFSTAREVARFAVQWVDQQSV